MLVMVYIVNGGLHATFCDRNSDIKLHKINRHIIVLTSTKKNHRHICPKNRNTMQVWWIELHTPKLYICLWLGYWSTLLSTYACYLIADASTRPRPPTTVTQHGTGRIWGLKGLSPRTPKVRNGWRGRRATSSSYWRKRKGLGLTINGVCFRHTLIRLVNLNRQGSRVLTRKSKIVFLNNDI